MAIEVNRLYLCLLNIPLQLSGDRRYSTSRSEFLKLRRWSLGFRRLT
jgi:hypothetical protein